MLYDASLTSCDTARDLPTLTVNASLVFDTRGRTELAAGSPKRGYWCCVRLESSAQVNVDAW